MSEHDSLDDVWRALASPVRRRILDRLKKGPLSTGRVAEGFRDLSRFAVMQHLGVLERGGLVIRRRTGRTTMNYFNPVPIQQIYDRWIDRMRRPWAESLVDLKGKVEEEADPDEDERRADRAG